MTRWNRLRRLAGRLLADHDGHRGAGDAIYLTETAWRNHQPGPAKAPQIRERHFGADLRWARRGKAEPAHDAPRRGLLARLGLGKPSPTPGDEPGYFGTKVLGTPHPPRKDEPAPVAAPMPMPESVRKRAPKRAPEPALPPEPAPTPVAVDAPVPAVTPPTADKAAKPKKASKAAAGRDKARQAPAPARPAPKPKAPDKEQLLDTLFAKPGKTEPAKAKPAAPAKKKKGKMDRGDVTVAVLGTALAVVCATFPWYIFFNQEKFGVREFVFSGGGNARPTPGIAYHPRHIGKPFATAEVPKMELDFFPTATLPTEQEPVRAVPASEQPFPADRVGFRLVHVANGRAMIEDADGLWVVQRGSQLPDASRVVTIEQRQGRWVLVTSNDTVVELGG